MKSRWGRIQRLYWTHVATDWQRANHNLRQTNRLYSRLIAEAEKKSGKSTEEVDVIYAEWRAVREPEEDEVARLLSAHWLRRAARHYIPEPDPNDTRYWRPDERCGRTFYLNNAGIEFVTPPDFAYPAAHPSLAVPGAG
jgi:hypothetical protein